MTRRYRGAGILAIFLLWPLSGCASNMAAPSPLPTDTGTARPRAATLTPEPPERLDPRMSPLQRSCVIANTAQRGISNRLHLIPRTGTRGSDAVDAAYVELLTYGDTGLGRIETREIAEVLEGYLDALQRLREAAVSLEPDADNWDQRLREAGDAVIESRNQVSDRCRIPLAESEEILRRVE